MRVVSFIYWLALVCRPATSLFFIHHLEQTVSIHRKYRMIAFTLANKEEKHEFHTCSQSLYFVSSGRNGIKWEDAKRKPCFHLKVNVHWLEIILHSFSATDIQQTVSFEDCLLASTWDEKELKRPINIVTIRRANRWTKNRIIDNIVCWKCWWNIIVKTDSSISDNCSTGISNFLRSSGSVNGSGWWAKTLMHIHYARIYTILKRKNSKELSIDATFKTHVNPKFRTFQVASFMYENVRSCFWGASVGDVIRKAISYTSFWARIFVHSTSVKLMFSRVCWSPFCRNLFILFFQSLILRVVWFVWRHTNTLLFSTTGHQSMHIWWALVTIRHTHFRILAYADAWPNIIKYTNGIRAGQRQPILFVG